MSKSKGTPWRSVQFVIETVRDGGRFKSHICLKLFGGDRIDAAKLDIGQTVKVSFDIDAHQYKDTWYNDINCFKVEHVQSQQQMQRQYPQQGGYQQPFPPPQQGGGYAPQRYDGDDVPY